MQARIANWMLLPCINASLLILSKPPSVIGQRHLVTVYPRLAIPFLAKVSASVPRPSSTLSFAFASSVSTSTAKSRTSTLTTTLSFGSSSFQNNIPSRQAVQTAIQRMQHTDIPAAATASSSHLDMRAQDDVGDSNNDHVEVDNDNDTDGCKTDVSVPVGGGNESDGDGNGVGDSESDGNNIRMHTHYIFLVHGWLGNSNEMKYIETSIQRAVAVQDSSNSDGDGDGDGESQSIHCPRIITHSAISNDSQTTDGIANGGLRLAREVEEFIQKDMQNFIQNGHDDENEHHVSISFVGNSLGGLYARYALSQLPPQISIPTRGGMDMDMDMDMDQKGSSSMNIQIHYNIFATTATPHLGVASHTFLPLPRFAEEAIGRSLRQTGKDLFRIDGRVKRKRKFKFGPKLDQNDAGDDGQGDGDTGDDLIYQMSTNYPKFLKHLQMFERRIAYANAFRTDFQVPTTTAAFLNKNSTYPHYIRNVESSKSSPKSNPFIVAVAETKRNEELLQQNAGISKCLKHTMSVKLDALGWEKVFVDVREYIPLPSVGLPFAKKSGSRTRKHWEDFIKRKMKMEQEMSVGNGDDDDDDKDGNVIVVESSTLEKYMTSSDKFNVPVGHQVMVANSKSKSYTSFTKNGRPVMDHLADDIVKSLLGGSGEK